MNILYSSNNEDNDANQQKNVQIKWRQSTPKIVAAAHRKVLPSQKKYLRFCTSYAQHKTFNEHFSSSTSPGNIQYSLSQKSL